MKITRREFHKMFGIGVSVLYVNPFSLISKTTAYSWFNEASVYGNFVKIADTSPDTIKKAFDCTISEIKEVVPPEYRKRVVWAGFKPRATLGDPLGQIGCITWKTVPVGTPMPSKRVLLVE